MPTRFADHILKGTTAARPAASAVPAGTIYASTTDGVVYQSDGTSWGTWLAAAAAGSVAADAIWDTKGDLAVATGADTASKLPVGSNNQVLTADSAQTTGVKWATASSGALALLSTTTLGADGTFDVSAISGSYNDLLVVLIARSTLAGNTDNPTIRFNNDSAGNYNAQRFRAGSSTAQTADSSSASTSAGVRIDIPAATATSSLFGYLELTIPGYASTTWSKQFAWLEVAAWLASTMYAGFGGGIWNSTAAITRIQVSNGSVGNLLAGSQLRIYGRL